MASGAFPSTSAQNLSNVANGGRFYKFHQRIYLADIIAADNGAGVAGTIKLANLAAGHLVTRVAVYVTTALVVSDSGSTLTLSVGDNASATAFTAANSVLGTATPVLNFGTGAQGEKVYAGTSALLLTLTPASGKNLNTVTAGQFDVLFTVEQTEDLCNPLVP